MDDAVTVTNNMLQKVCLEFKYCPDNFRATSPAHIKVYLTWVPSVLFYLQDFLYPYM
jgi:hypothetical protein